MVTAPVRDIIVDRVIREVPCSYAFRVYPVGLWYVVVAWRGIDSLEVVTISRLYVVRRRIEMLIIRTVKKLARAVACHSCKVGTATHAYKGRALCACCLRAAKMRDEQRTR